MRLDCRDLSFRYSDKQPFILEHFSMSVSEGERVGLMAPSGSGKSTLAKLLAGILRPASGEVLLDGRPLQSGGVRPVQLIFQHPELAINPRWRMRRVLEEAGEPEPELLAGLGIEGQWLGRYPRELSGGELQRFCIARALLSNARFIIADEMTTMFDVITQAQIWEAMLDAAQKRSLGLIVVSHNRRLIDRLCTSVIELKK